MLLSECEEGKPYVVDLFGRWTVLCRRGEDAYGYPIPANITIPFGPASSFVVIQPVEVNRE